MKVLSDTKSSVQYIYMEDEYASDPLLGLILCILWIWNQLSVFRHHQPGSGTKDMTVYTP